MEEADCCFSAAREKLSPLKSRETGSLASLASRNRSCLEPALAQQSLSAAVTLRQDAGGNIHPFSVENVGFCPGTTIDINLRTDLIEQLPEEREELEW